MHYPWQRATTQAMKLLHNSWLVAAILLNGMAAHAHASDTDVMDALKQGGVVVMLRHAQTTEGVGDPPNFKLTDCSTQRNLSDAGRDASRRMGAWFAAQGIRVDAVKSSEWCRCKDTAQLAFGSNTPWTTLNSFFDNRSAELQQTTQLKRALRKLKPGQREVWVTHQVNITALTGVAPEMGEAVVLRQGKSDTVQVIGRLSFDRVQ
jgi:phosphohistidine phosphatase SixA